MSRKKRFWLFAAMAGIVVTAVWAACFHHINRAYPQAELIRVGINEPLQYGPYTVTANRAYMEDTVTLYEENGLSVEDKTLPELTLVCAVTIKRNSSGPADPIQTGLRIPHIAAASGAWSNMADTGELYTALNEGSAAPDKLREGERQTYLLTFGIWTDSLAPDSLKNLKDRPFTLQLSLYPGKYEIVVI